ncbi:MAG: SH3 domain-containing protein [Chloroflexota bacterium]|nr:SH3 domain-containing protein [Chloroflexota bacterium]
MSNQFKLKWPVDKHVITQYFGENPHIYARFHQAGHEGLDFSAAVGDNIYACADGTVIDVHPNNGTAYGLYVRLQHRVDGAVYQTIYAHLSEVLVVEHQSVSAGERIALSGDTGHSFAPHLHLTLKLIGAKTSGYPDGVVDPLPYLREEEIPAPSDLTIYTTDQVRLRAKSTTASTHLAWLDGGEALTVLGDSGVARARVGEYGQWIQVQRADGMNGFVAAWYVQLESPAPSLPEEPAPEPELPDTLAVHATEALNVRNGPSTGSSRIGIALPNDPLEIVGDWRAALAKIGDRSQWLHVRLPSGRKGYVAAWYVQLNPGSAPDALLTIYPTQDMNMRERPTVRAKRVGRLAHNTPLVVHDDQARARVLVGRYDEWLYVETPAGEWGWVAAWYVSTAQT